MKAVRESILNHWPVTPAEYLADREHVSSGGLRSMRYEGPWFYHARYVADTLPTKESQEIRFGRAFHLAMYDWSEFETSFVFIRSQLEDGPAFETVCKDWEGRDTVAELIEEEPLNTAYKPHREYLELRKQEATAAGKEWLLADQVEPILSMIDSCHADPAVRELLDHPLAQTKNAEVALAAVDEPTGLKTKALVDLHLGDIIVDWKSTRRYRTQDFVRDGREHGYPQQAAHYLKLSGASLFVFVAVRNKPPREAHRLDIPINDRLFVGEFHRNRHALEVIAACQQSGEWHDDDWGTAQRYFQTEEF